MGTNSQSKALVKSPRRHKERCEIINLKQPVWEQQRYEPPAAFGQFQLFRDMGSTRTQQQVCAEANLSRTVINDRAQKWRWIERAEAWDKHLDSIKTKAVEDASKTMATRQAKLGMMLQDKAVSALEVLDISEATAKDVVQMAEAGVKIERLARGEQTGDDTNVTILLPVMPAWAKTSKYVAALPPTPIEADVTEVVETKVAQGV